MAKGRIPLSLVRSRWLSPKIALLKGDIEKASHEFKFGFNNDISTIEETVWDGGGLYTYISSATVLKISSGSANDTAGGTGARTVKIIGLDGDYIKINETVTLNGQTSVNTSKSYLRPYRLIVITAGSGGQNAGIIYAGTGNISSGVPDNVFAQISVAQNQTLMCLYSIAAGQSAYLASLEATVFDTPGGQTAAGTFRLVMRPLGEVFQTQEKFVLANATWLSDLRYEHIFPAKSDIEIRAVSNANTIAVSASISLIIVND